MKTVASGYTNQIAVAIGHGILILAERTCGLYFLDLKLKLQVKPASMKKAEMKAFVTRHRQKLFRRMLKIVAYLEMC